MRRPIARVPGWAALAVAPAGLLAVFLLYPVVRTVAIGLAWDGAGLDTTSLRIVGFTVALSAVAAVLSTTLALPVAWVLYRREFPSRRAWRAVILVPFALPTVVVGLAFGQLSSGIDDHPVLGSPLLWILVALLFYNVSLGVRLVGSVWASLAPEPERVASTLGLGPAAVFVRVTLPRLRSAILASVALVFLFAATSFGVVMLLGKGRVRTIETEIYLAAMQRLDLRTAAALAIVQTVITLLAFWLVSRWRTGLEGGGEAPVMPRLVPRQVPLALLAVLPLAVLAAVPLALLVWRSFQTSHGLGLDNYLALASAQIPGLDTSVLGAAVNSARNAFVAGSAALVIGACVAALAALPSPSRVARFVQRTVLLWSLLPLGLSSVVLGMGYLLSFGAPLYWRSSWWMLPVAQALIALPLVVQLLTPALRATGERYREVALTLGAPAWLAWLRVDVPLTAPAFQSAFAYAMLASVGEFGAASFLVLPEQGTLPTVLYRLISRPGSESFGMALATAVMLVVLAFALTLLASAGRCRAQATSAW